MKLFRHTIFNLIGLGAPLLVAVGTIPVLIHELGPARFGLLTLIWAVVSYFGLFDLGLGRALTIELASVFANNEHSKVGPLVGTAIVIMALLGVFAGVLMALSASWGVGLIHDVPDRQETIHAVYAMALAMPFIVLTSGLRSILEARHAFGAINIIRLPMGLLTFLGPLAVVLYATYPRLDNIAWVLVAGRIIGCSAHAYYAWNVLPTGRGPLSFRVNLLKPLCAVGGWMTISNIISPLMSYVDRFVIGIIVSASAVTYYSTPQELVMKLSIVPVALTAVLFPALSSLHSHDDESTYLLIKRSAVWLFLAILPMTAALTLFSNQLLAAWIGVNFARQSATLLQILSIAMFIGAMAQIPFTLIQSAGYSRITAIIHCAELPFFLPLLWLLTSHFGIFGTACSWMIRVIADALIMAVACMIIMKRSVIELFNLKLIIYYIFAILSFAGALLPEGFGRLLWILLIISVVCLISIRILKSRFSILKY